MISRAGMAARGVPPTTVNGWYRDRARTGHPEKAGRIGRTDYWYEDEWTAWHEAYQRGKIESLAQVDLPANTNTNTTRRCSPSTPPPICPSPARPMP